MRATEENYLKLNDQRYVIYRPSMYRSIWYVEHDDEMGCLYLRLVENLDGEESWRTSKSLKVNIEEIEIADGYKGEAGI